MDRQEIDPSFKIEVYLKVQESIKELYPIEFAKRIEELREERSLIEDQIFFVVEIGNTFREIHNPKLFKTNNDGYKKMKYGWKLFVRGVGPHAKLVHILIKKIAIKLSPHGCKDFKKEQMELVSETSFEINSTSWCIFDVPIEVQWVD